MSKRISCDLTKILERRGHLAWSPAIRTGQPAGDLTLRSPMHRHRKLLTESIDSHADLVDGSRAYYQLAVRSQPADLEPLVTGKRGGSKRSHVPILDVSSPDSSPNILLSRLDEPSNMEDMSLPHGPWKQREFFRALVDAKEKFGITRPEQATGIGIAETSLTTWYSSNREPGKKTMKLLASYYEVGLADLTDDPGASLPGVDSDEMSRMTPAKRLVLRSIAQKLGPDDVTDEAAERYLKVIDSLVDAGKIRPPK